MNGQRRPGAPGMVMATLWTGADATALRVASRYSIEGFAARLGIGVRTVSAWGAKPDVVPRPELQSILDTALANAPTDAQRRFQILADRPDMIAA